MKKIVLLICFLMSVVAFGQNNGITYQAVIYSASGESVPGIHNSSSPLVNKSICLQFSIVDENTQTEYQEKVAVTTDSYGMVNLVIGNGTQTGGYASSFSAIVWSNSQKYLKVSLDQSGNCSVFEEISNQVLTYVPFALAATTATNVSGIVGIANGGTNATTVAGAKTNLQLQNVDNTSDLSKPLSTAAQTALNTKVDKVNGKDLSTNDYTTAEKTKLASLGGTPDLSGYATLMSPAFNGTPTAPTASSTNISTQVATTAFVNNAFANKFVDLTTNQNIGGIKTFNSDLVVNQLVIGKGKGQNNYNTAFGAGALNSSNANGTRNTAIGYLALTQYAGNTFDNNTGVGYFNMIGLTTGYGNTSLGAETMFNVGVASNNTAIGNQSLINTAGDNNVGVGARSGDGLTTGTNNTFIGTQARTTSAGATISNATALGYGAVVTENNTIQLGNLGVTNVKTSGSYTGSGFKTPTGTSSQYLMADGSVSTSSSTTGVDLTTDQTIAGVKTFSPVLTAVADNTSLIGLNIDPQFNEGSFSGINKTALKLKGDLSFTEGTNFIKFANGSMVGDIQNNGTDPTGTVDLYSPEGASWIQMNYGNRNYFWIDNVSTYLSTGRQGVRQYDWVFNGDNGMTELPGSIRAGGITYPATDGSAGQVLSTDGSGNVTWQDISSSNLSSSGVPYTGATGSVNLGNNDITASKFTGTNLYVSAINDMAISVGASDYNETNFIGSSAMAYAGGGFANTAFGHLTLSETHGDNNTAFGAQAMRGNTTGSGNTAVGRASLNGNLDGNNNTALGYDTRVSSPNLENTTAIGAGAIVDASNTIQLGNTSVTDVKTNGAITASGFKTASGTSSQFLKADGSIDTNTYVASNTDNIAIGYVAGSGGQGLHSIAIGSNVAQGAQAEGGVGIGYAAAQYNQGENAVAIGKFAGKNNQAAYSIAIGSDAEAYGVNSIALGSSAGVINDNTIQLGNGDITDVKTYGAITAAGFKTPTGTSLQYLMADGSVSNLSSSSSSSSSGVPYTGASRSVDLGAFDLKVNGLTVGIGFGGQATNVVVGKSAMENNTTGGYSVAVGLEALKSNTDGNSNTAIGHQALRSNTTGGANIAIGMNAMPNNTIGQQNIAIGQSTLYNNTNASGNTVIGNSAATDITTGGLNTIIGHETAGGLTTGSWNTIIGRNAYTGNISNNIVLSNGQGAIKAQHDGTNWTLSGITTATGFKTPSGTSSQYLMADGSVSNSSSTTGVDLTTNQTVAGSKTFSSDITVNGLTVGKGLGNRNSNTAIGASTLSSNTSGFSNTANGFEALKLNISGNYNTAIGTTSLSSNTTGSQNTSIGIESMQSNTTGNGNASLGRQSLFSNTEGNYNTGLGIDALSGNTTGSYGVGIGQGALSANETGRFNTAVGSGANVATNNLTNATAIGNGAIVSSSNSIQLGNSDVTNVKTNGSITASGYKTPTGTSSQYLMADGSVNSAKSPIFVRSFTKTLNNLVNCSVQSEVTIGDLTFSFVPKSQTNGDGGYIAVKSSIGGVFQCVSNLIGGSSKDNSIINLSSTNQSISNLVLNYYDTFSSTIFKYENDGGHSYEVKATMDGAQSVLLIVTYY